jgi:hypothetical protein
LKLRLWWVGDVSTDRPPIFILAIQPHPNNQLHPYPRSVRA